MPPLARLLAPRSVAIVGASADPAKLTGRPLAYLERYGFTGAIYPVNPRYESIGRHRCYPSAAALPQPPDAAIVLLGAEKAADAVRALAAAGCGAAVVLASGFGETGTDGQQRQEELRRAAGAMRILGPNSIGLVNATDHVVLSASNALVTEDILPGRIALVSQSGGILGSLLSRAQAAGVGFSKLIATGNECDLEISDFIAHLADDPSTDVIALYLETLRRPKAFQAAVLRARAAGKPVVAFKVGRSESGARSAASHTGALAGSDALYGALFRQSGVIRAERYSDLLDIPLALAAGPALDGNRVAIITSTGGAAGLLADAAGLAGFDTPAPDAPTAAALTALAIPDAVLDRNPIDVTLAGVKSDTFRTILDAVVASPTYDAVAVVLGSSALRDPDAVGGPLRETAAAAGKPVIGFVSPSAPQLVRRLNSAGVPTFTEPESCAAALAAMRHRARAAPEAAASAATLPLPADVRALLPPGPLNEAESKRLFAAFGIRSVREAVAENGAEAAAVAQGFAGRVVIKVLSRAVLHKSEIGGVAVGIEPRDAERTCGAMAERLAAATGQAPEGFLVQELISEGVELILGLHHDIQLGDAVLLGMGGVAAEVYRDTTLRLAPLARADAEAMIDELRSAPLLKGFRGRPPADLPALVDAILAFSDMIGVLGDRLLEAEINPLFVLPQGRGVRAADGLAVLAPLSSSSP